MKIIFVGSVYPNEDYINNLKSLGSKIDNAAHTFQKAVLSGLQTYFTDITVVTAPNITSYPKVKRFTFATETFVQNKLTCLFTGFINFPLLKHLSKANRILHALRALYNEKEDYLLLVYSVHSPFLVAVNLFRKKNIKTCLVVPDLPEYMSDKRNILYLFGKKIDKCFIDRCVKNIDSFVLLSPYMKDKLPIGNKPWIQMEGIFNMEQYDLSIPKERYKTILYTGNIDERYGIVKLLDAFALIKSDDYRLWIRGNGNTLGLIKERQKEDPRIIYFEQMSRSELLSLQRKATLLVNPVPPSQEFTRFFFPSKTMEYMASGTPTLMFKLDCLPKDYYSYLYFFGKEDSISMKSTIETLCSKDQEELNLFGKQASEFIINNKSAKVQVGRMYDMLKSKL